MIKMSDVFELPVSTDETFDDYSCMTVSGLVLLQDHAEHAAHDINNFVGLVEALEDALKLLIKTFDAQKSDYYESSITLSDLGKIHAALTAAKGETK
jgi:hypothetical protein